MSGPIRIQRLSTSALAIPLICIALVSSCYSPISRPDEIDLAAAEDPPPLWPERVTQNTPAGQAEDDAVRQEYLKTLNNPKEGEETGAQFVDTMPYVPRAMRENPDQARAPDATTTGGTRAKADLPPQMTSTASPLELAIREARLKYLENPDDRTLEQKYLLLLLAGDSIEEADKIVHQLKDDADCQLLVLKFLVSRRIGEEEEAARLAAEILEMVNQSLPLRVESVALCTVIRGFADYDPFPSYSFLPGATVALYIQPENFSCAWEDGTERYRTALDIDLEILTQTREKIPWPSWNPRNGRYEKRSIQPINDLFLSVLLKLPDTMTVGEYVLRVVVKDSSSDKAVAEREIPFSIR